MNVITLKIHTLDKVGRGQYKPPIKLETRSFTLAREVRIFFWVLEGHKRLTGCLPLDIIRVIAIALILKGM